jgi:hypothetical protein
MSYFLISVSEDGDVGMHKMDAAALAKHLNETTGSKFATSIPDTDLMRWGDYELIIKGEIVVPTPREMVTKWEVP